MTADELVLAARINAERATSEQRPAALRARAFAECKRIAEIGFGPGSRAKCFRRHVDELKAEGAWTEHAELRIAEILDLDPSVEIAERTPLSELLAAPAPDAPTKAATRPAHGHGGRVRGRSRERRSVTRRARAPDADDDGPASPSSPAAPFPIWAAAILLHAAGVPSWAEDGGLTAAWCVSCGVPFAHFDELGSHCERGCDQVAVFEALRRDWR